MKCPNCNGEPEYVEVSLDDGTRTFEDCWVRASYKDGKFSFSFDEGEYGVYYNEFNMKYQYDMVVDRLSRGYDEEVICPLCHEEAKMDKDGNLSKLTYLTI